MNNKSDQSTNEPCTESKLLALHTAVVCLARALAVSGQLDRGAFKSQLDSGREWLERHSGGHDVQAFDDIMKRLGDV